MKNFLQPGATIDVVAPSGGLTGGQFYVLGAIHGVVANDAAAGESVALNREGIFTLPKATGTAWVMGDVLYWDATNKVFTKTAAGNRQVGAAAAAAASGEATGAVAIDEVANLGGVVGGSYTAVAGDQTATTKTIATGLSSISGFVVMIIRAGKMVSSDPAVSASAGNITVANGVSYVLTANDVIQWIALGAP